MSELKIHDSGEGPALLMLHAFPLDASMWDAQVAALSGRYRCLRPDFWGCGSSPPPPGAETIDGYAATVLRELDERGVTDFAVCGSSMGGYMIFALLRAARDRVRLVVLAGTRAAADNDAARAARMEMAEQVRNAGTEAIVETMTDRLLCPRCRGEVHIADPVRGRIRRCSAEGVVSAIDAVAGRPDSTPMLRDIRVPTGGLRHRRHHRSHRGVARHGGGHSRRAAARVRGHGSPPQPRAADGVQRSAGRLPR